MADKIQKAITIFKTKMPDAKGKFRAYISDAEGNNVDIFNEDGLYCTVNIRSGNIKGI